MHHKNTQNMQFSQQNSEFSICFEINLVECLFDDQLPELPNTNEGKLNISRKRMTFMGVDARENGKKWIGNQNITNEWTATHTNMQQQQDVHRTHTVPNKIL